MASYRRFPIQCHPDLRSVLWRLGRAGWGRVNGKWVRFARDLPIPILQVGGMTATHCFIRAQGRVLSPGEFVALQRLIDEHPEWSRHRIARELCQAWDWRACAGQLKTFAARTLLLTLERRHHLRLPAVREPWRRRPWGIERQSPGIPRPATFIECSLEALKPFTWQIGSYGTGEPQRALGLLRQFHYLGCNRPVGAHLLYLVRDGQGREVAVHLVGAAVWQCAPRDAFVGWNSSQRGAHLSGVGNHSRFLILPWVRVPHLASHLLSQLIRRLSADWPRHHGWRLSLLESFVEVGRFVGTAYRAAGWREAGQTTGRTRQEKKHRVQAARKSVWVCPLHPHFRRDPGLGGAR